MSNDPSALRNQPVARSLTIGSPRMMSPRSHRTHRSRRSPRQEFTEEDNINRELEEGQTARAAANLKTPDISNTFNVDPEAPFLAPAGDETIRDLEEQHSREREEAVGRDGSRFVGGFMFDRLKKAVQGASIQWGSGSRRAQGIDNAYTPPYALNDQTSLPETSHQREYSSSDDATHYPATTEEGTTAIDHTMPQPQYVVPPSIVIGSPEFVEPLPAEDYRKMEFPSPPPSLTITTYFSRLKKLVKDINALPWVATDRITADYYPGQARRREQTKHGAGHIHRSAISLSWYGENYLSPGALEKRQVDLTAGESPEVMTNGNVLHPGPSSSGHEYGSEGFYTSETGQVWPVISTVYPGAVEQTPVNPNLDYHPDRLRTPPPEIQFPTPLPIASHPTLSSNVYYTSDAGQTWPVVAPGYSTPVIPTAPHFSSMAGPSH